MKRRKFLLSTAGVALGALAVPSPAQAFSEAPTLVTDPPAAERDFVRWLSIHDPRATVRSVARTALLSSDGAAAITAFLASGYASAATRAAETRARQLDYATRMADTHPAQYYPWVNATARRAANGTDTELADYSSTGYAAALKNDNAQIPYDDGAALVTEDDRELVSGVADADPSLVVRDRAAGVTTDAEVAEFLRYGWLSAAGIATDEFRAQYVADERSLWSEARQQTATAVAVAATNPVAAIQLWYSVRTRFAPLPTGWTARQRYALARSDDWRRTVQTAAASASPLWAPLAARGPALSTQWYAEVTNAADQAAWWTALLQYAQAAASVRP
ncbi:hypothetical protein BJ973_002775 [Actinoplanes tereljensis]|uniref:Uncharacterized protein n=1 Tax=Paractinoplanes tereljensis TaxID=571912 RepID=A0A919NR16_9ACTN|nr:hypothetical protein [Actinoplanes tereljensis]GIF22454.1 hypothetical protein Ate02nite_51840 [Actinoplanes tereljensis]